MRIFILSSIKETTYVVQKVMNCSNVQLPLSAHAAKYNGVFQYKGNWQASVNCPKCSLDARSPIEANAAVTLVLTISNEPAEPGLPIGK